MAKRRAKFKVGDVVRVDNPLHVVRVGYPKCLEDFAEEAEELLVQFTPALGILLERERLPLLRTIKGIRLRQCGYGGKERTLHLETKEDWRGQECIVSSIRRKMTGTYSPGYMSRGCLDYEPEWEPAYLESAKTHTLLTLFRRNGGRFTDEDLEIEACNVTLIEHPLEVPSDESGWDL